jgi:hypothetical protein
MDATWGIRVPDKKPDKIRSHCNSCGGERNHLVLHMEDSTWFEEVNEGRNSISGSDTYFLLKCGGCDAVHLRHESTFSEDFSDGPTVRLYPPAVSRRQPTWARDMAWPLGSDAETTIGELLEEIYAALQSDSRRSAAMAIRALLEVVMIDKVGDQGAIGKNISAFFAAGYVPVASQDLFRDTIMEAGNAAMHRSWKPSAHHLEVLMDLTEWLVASLYVHPQQAASLKIPPRKSH